MKRFLDFDLSIDSTDGGYRAHVLSSPAGQASCKFNIPLSPDEIEILLLRAGRPRRAVRRIASPETDAVRSFGRRIYSAVFAESVGLCLSRSVDIAESRGVGLRIRLRLSGAPELGGLPWEYLYSPTKNIFFALSKKTPIVRFLELPEETKPLRVTGPIRILAMVSSPLDVPQLNVEIEYQNVVCALASLHAEGKVAVERMEEATMACLQRTLRRRDFHIFHFIGHGGYRQQSDEGVLLFEDSFHRSREVTGETIGTILHDHDSLRLAVLNACEGARSGFVDPFSGVAQSLIQKGLPSVVAMQFEITDDAAITFAHEFYSALAENCPIETALAEARKIIFGQGDNVEWGTPVLYLRAHDGLIFNVEPEKNQFAALEVQADADQSEEYSNRDKARIEKERDDKTVAEQKARDDKAVAEQKARDDKAVAEQKARDGKAVAEQKARDGKAVAEQKARDHEAAAERKDRREKMLFFAGCLLLLILIALLFISPTHL